MIGIIIICGQCWACGKFSDCSYSLHVLSIMHKI